MFAILQIRQVCRIGPGSASVSGTLHRAVAALGRIAKVKEGRKSAVEALKIEQITTLESVQRHCKD